MEGNAGEWCRDWFGSVPGGVQTDPTGPAFSASGRKVVRGGAFDNSEQSSRSASRLLFSEFSPLTDSDLGFRVVLSSRGRNENSTLPSPPAPPAPARRVG